jgi:hypothetical protein
VEKSLGVRVPSSALVKDWRAILYLTKSGDNGLSHQIVTLKIRTAKNRFAFIPMRPRDISTFFNEATVFFKYSTSLSIFDVTGLADDK